MAALSVSYCLLGINHELKEHKNISITRTLVPFSCQNSKPVEKEDLNQNRDKRQKRLPALQALGVVVSKLSKGLKENLSPKQKGDWKDVLLMSFSFAVYVYMSQRIVCAYCAWMSMLKQPW